MALSEREQRLLQEMESNLLAEDSRWAALDLRRSPLRVRGLLALVTAAAGIALLALGVARAGALGTLIALVGFGLLLTGTVLAARWAGARHPGNPLQRAVGRARRANSPTRDA